MLKQFLLNLFRGAKLANDLEQVRTAARHDAQLVVGAYLDEFETEASRMMLARQQRLIGTDTNIIDSECVPASPATTAKRRKQ